MNSIQLRYSLLKMKLSVSTGVYAADQLKYINSKSFAIIVNNLDSTQNGMHWLGIIKKSNQNYVEFFDSFALHPSFYGVHFVKFLKKCGGRVRLNSFQIQSNNSETCGNFCLYFIKKRFNGYSFEKVLKNFDVKNLKKNDELVKKFVNQIYFPTFSRCMSYCSGECFKNNKLLTDVCIQKNKRCVKLSQEKEKMCTLK